MADTGEIVTSGQQMQIHCDLASFCLSRYRKAVDNYAAEWASRSLQWQLDRIGEMVRAAKSL